MPPLEIPEMLKKYGGVFGKGVVIQMAPAVMKGILIEMMRKRGSDVASTIKWVESNESLWDAIEPKQKEMLSKFSGKLGSLDWLDSAWAIDALKDEFPGVASLFLGWKRGRNWLERQLAEIKKEIKG